jgi:DNA polymerase-1
MKLIDVHALTPRALREPDRVEQYQRWLHVLQEVHESKHLILPEERLQTLRRLKDDVWGDAIVLTRDDQFLFWRLADPRVLITTPAGRKLPGGMRTDDTAQWAAGIIAGGHQRTKTQKVLKAQPEEVIEVQRQLSARPSLEMDLIETNGNYTLVTPETIEKTEHDLLWMLAGGAPFGLDTETEDAGEDDTGAPNPYQSNLVGLSVSYQPGTGYYFPTLHRDEDGTPLPDNLDLERVKALVTLIMEQSKLPVWHNCKYDFGVLANPIQQIPISWVYERWLPKTQDTMLMAALLNYKAGLKPLAEAKLGVKSIDFKRLTAGRPFSYVPLNAATIYAGQDADWTLQLYPILKQEMEAWDQKPGINLTRIYELERSIIELFMRMERRGIHIDQHMLARQIDLDTEYRANALDFLRQASKHAGIDLPDDWNPNSPLQVAKLLFDDVGLPVLTLTKTGNRATGAKAMNALKAKGVAHPILSGLRAFKKYDKRLTAFEIPIRDRHLQFDGRVRTSYGQVGAATGRTTSSGPNLQQWYPDLRKMFRGVIGGIDYSQVELRVLAAIHKDPAMVDTFQQPPLLDDGSPNPEADPHYRTMVNTGLDKLFDAKRARTFAKNYNFGIAFGAEAPTLSDTTGQSRALTEQLLNTYWRAHSTYDQSLRAMRWEHLARGYTSTWAGRLRILDTAEHKTKENHRLISNTPVQGGALDIAKHAARELLPLIREVESVGIHPFNFVHDEFDFELDQYHANAATTEEWQDFLLTVAGIMERVNPFKATVPIRTSIETGTDWGSVKEVDWADTLLEYQGEEYGDPDDLQIEIEEASSRDS